jgi:DNA-binding NarL/FixJ family response regulator
MRPEPVILILEDERLQLLTLRAQLADIATLKEFSDPGAALEFARRHSCAAAIVDIRMPRRPMDGLGFLKALRTFDTELAVIVRTADESGDVADGAIEFRAIRRAIKSKTSAVELRQMVLGAMKETHQRRDLVAKANRADLPSSKRRSSNVDLEIQRAAIALSGGLIQGLRKRLTNLSVLASLMRMGASETRRAALVDQADKASAVIKEMAESIDIHEKGAFALDSSSQTTSVNECLAALSRFFSSSDRWAAKTRRLLIRSPRTDASIHCPPVRIFGALKDLAEVFLSKVADGGVVFLTVEIVADERFRENHAQGSRMLFCQNEGGEYSAWAVFRVSADIDSEAIEESARREAAGATAAENEQSIWASIAANCNGMLSISKYRPTTIELSIPVEGGAERD